MPGKSGWEVLDEVVESAPSTKVVVLSVHSGEEWAAESRRRGALGYVAKLAGAQEVVTAIREAAFGRSYVSAVAPEANARDDSIRRAEDGTDPFHALTARERGVMGLLAEGLTSRDIASRMAISPRTVENHTASISKKLRIKTRTALVAYAVRRHISGGNDMGDGDLS